MVVQGDGPRWPVGLETLRIFLAQVPPVVLRASLCSQVGQAFVQGTKPLSVDGVAIWLATKAPEAGMLWMDVAQATRGQYVVRGAPLLPTTVLSAVLRSAFLARVPILVLHSDSPPDEEWASLTRSAD